MLRDSYTGVLEEGYNGVMSLELPVTSLRIVINLVTSVNEKNDPVIQSQARTLELSSLKDESILLIQWNTNRELISMALVPDIFEVRVNTLVTCSFPSVDGGLTTRKKVQSSSFTRCYINPEVRSDLSKWNNFGDENVLNGRCPIGEIKRRSTCRCLESPSARIPLLFILAQ